MIPIPPFVVPNTPATNITPFTYRDGLTYLQRLERIVKYIQRELIPYVSASYGELAEAFETEVNSLIEAVNTTLTEQTGEVDQKITDLEDMVNFTVNTINTSFNNLEDFVHQTMQDVIDDSIQVQDPVVAGIINDEDSATSIALSARNAQSIAESLDNDAGALAVQPTTVSPAVAVTNEGAATYPIWMSRDRSTLFSNGALNVRYSTDNGASWASNGNALPEGTTAIRDLPDGEILVAAGTAPGKLYRSSGWAANKATATFTEVLSASGSDIYFHNSWGLWVGDDGIVLAGEYGSKVANANARYVYLSLDYGATWDTILDIGGTVETHVHGVAYDKWWRRIWVSRGDASTAIYYSDDLGKTWSTVTRKESSQKSQPTTILPMPGCVLFLSDSAPNGVLRIRRRNRNDPMLEVAYRLNTDTSITHIGQLAYQSDVPGSPALLSFTNDPSAGYTGPGRLLATSDGFRFWELWKDSIDYGAFGGLYSCVGPTTDGKYLGTLIDGRQANYSRVTVTAPTWTVPEGNRLATALGDETMPRISASGHPVLVSGTMMLTYFRATRTADIANLRAFTGETAAANTATLFRLGLYEVDAAGNLALLSAGTSDVVKIQTAYNEVGQNIAARTVAGRWYAVGVLCIGPDQMPTLAGVSAAGGGVQLSSVALNIAPRLCGQVPGQTDLPESVAAGSVANGGRVYYHAAVRITGD